VIDEEKIERALGVGLDKIRPSAGLLAKIQGAADLLEGSDQFIRPSGLWSRFRLGTLLEFATVAVVLVSLVVVYGYQNSLRQILGSSRGSMGDRSESVWTDTQRWPSPDQIASAYVSGGGPKISDWHLTKKEITKVLSMLQSAEWLASDEAQLPPIRGLVPSLIIELTQGERILIQQARDCHTVVRPEGKAETCTAAEGQILVSREGHLERWRTPELVKWLTEGNPWVKEIEHP
jgi:hypothetical protein